jgi:Histidine kinase-, DNA gyrase B-, and HSP90-like ATPase
VIVLGNLDRPEAAAGAGMRLGRQDLQLLSPLAFGLAVTLGNATQVARIKEEKSTLEQILGLSSDGIPLLDGKGRVRVWNHRAPAGLRRGADPHLRGAGAVAPVQPLAAVRGRGVTTDVVIVHDVTRIRQAERADHLARLVEDLLLASRISSEPGGTAVVGMQRECTDPAEAARRAEVDADPLRLVQVLANLISNAHKYSPTDQEVRLRVWRDNGWAMAAVSDRGRGIPREELDRVFEKFHRVEDPMTMTTSAPRRGSTFTVRQPLARRPDGGDDPAAGGRDRAEDTPPPAPRSRRAPDPLCRCS